MKTCESCVHWKYVGYTMGECEKINDKIGIELVTGWEGGYVKSIETEADFGCLLHDTESV